MQDKTAYISWPPEGGRAKQHPTPAYQGSGTRPNSMTGPNFMHPPPHPWKDPLRGRGVYKRGGRRIKFLPRGGSKYTPPPPPLRNALWPEMGLGGGGVYYFAPHKLSGQFRCNASLAIRHLGRPLKSTIDAEIKVKLPFGTRWVTILIPLEYFDVMHMKSLRKIIPPELSGVMIAYVVGGEARDLMQTRQITRYNSARIFLM